MQVKTRKVFVHFGVVAGMLTCLGLASLTPVAHAADNDLAEIKKQLQELKESHDALKKDVEDIQKRLPKPRQPIEDVSYTIDLGNTPRIRGTGNTKVVWVEVSEFQCPYCSRMNAQAGAQINKEYVETGKIKHAFVDLPLAFHQHAQKAAEAAECAGDQNKYWQMHDRLFANQSKISTNDLPGHAEALGLDVAKFTECVTSGKYAEEVKRDAKEANKYGITGTPTSVIGLLDADGKKVKAAKLVRGATLYQHFKEAIDAVLEDAEK